MGWVSNSKVWWGGRQSCYRTWWSCTGCCRTSSQRANQSMMGVWGVSYDISGEGTGHTKASTFTFGFFVYFCQNRLDHMRNPQPLPVNSFTRDYSKKAMAGKCFASVSLKKNVGVLIYWIQNVNSVYWFPKSCQLKTGSVYLNFLVSFIV